MGSPPPVGSPWRWPSAAASCVPPPRPRRPAAPSGHPQGCRGSVGWPEANRCQNGQLGCRQKSRRARGTCRAGRGRAARGLLPRGGRRCRPPTVAGAGRGRNPPRLGCPAWGCAVGSPPAVGRPQMPGWAPAAPSSSASARQPPGEGGGTVLATGSHVCPLPNQAPPSPAEPLTRMAP